MNLKKRILTLHGKEHGILAGKPTEIPNRSIYLLRKLKEERDFSLWLIETSEDKQKIDLWPYEGTDSEELIEELWEEFVATAFD